MENLIEKLRNEAIKINSYKNSKFEYSEFVPELCRFLQNLNELMTIDIEEALSILWYFVHEKTFEDKKEAEFEALKLVNYMNANFCKKHRFFVNEEGDTFRIYVELSCPKVS